MGVSSVNSCGFIHCLSGLFSEKAVGAIRQGGEESHAFFLINGFHQKKYMPATPTRNSGRVQKKAS